MKIKLFFIFLFMFINILGNTEPEKKEVKIAVIASYPISYVITYRKMGALKFTLAGIENTSYMKFRISAYYLQPNRDNKVNENEATYIQKFLDIVKADYIIVMDDLAFNILYKNNMITDNKKFMFVGLSYIDKENLDVKLKDYNIIYYLPDLTRLFNLIKKTNFTPDNLYIFTDISESSSVYMKQIMPQINKYISELYMLKKPVIIQITNLRELRRELAKLNQNYKSLITSCLVNVFNNEKNRYATKNEIFDTFISYNLKHLEVFLTLDAIVEGGAISVSPKRSELTIFAINLILGMSDKTIHYTPPSYIGINQDRLNKLRFNYIYEKGGDFVGIFY